LLIFDPQEANSFAHAPLDAIRHKATHVLHFPRQGKKPYRAISDYFRSDTHDVIAFSVVTSGARLSIEEAKLYEAGAFNDYYQMHGLGVELAESLAEMVHKQVRMDLNITQGKEKPTLNDVKLGQYQGVRYSFGYGACPNLEDNSVIFDLLKPEELGITLSETFQIVPEQSTSALIVYHPEAMYFNV
jgi:5-methyltetrahydrofolate--homocysteine methyltransferase